MCTRTQPRVPCAPTMRPTSSKPATSSLAGPTPPVESEPRRTTASLEDLEVRALAQLRGRGTQDRAHRLDRASLLADDLAQILFGHAKLQHDRLLARDLGHLHLIGVVDECAGEELDQFF